MPICADNQHCRDRLRTELAGIGLAWQKQYRVVEEGARWELDIIRLLTVWQFRRANEALKVIMNS